jgi:bleomycin hydrolase
MLKHTSIALLFVVAGVAVSFAQPIKRDKGQFREKKPGFYENSVLKGIDEDAEKVAPPKPVKVFKIDPASYLAPKSKDEFTTHWRNEPISQGNAGTCWSFSTTSFFETEEYRLHKKQVKLSEIWVAYWEYVEKANGFVQSRGTSHFDEGSEANAVTRIYRKYGVVPEEDFAGLPENKRYHNHSLMVAEMKAYLAKVKENSAWDETAVANTIKSILNHYVGEPPTTVKVEGKTYTPTQYLKDYLKLDMNEYYDVTSLANAPYYTQCEYDVPDNWWNSADYYNLPLDEYMNLIKTSIEKGYTMMIGGDVSEAGFDSWNNVAVVPSFDIPSEYIDEWARYMRFQNGSTTDDHGMHCIGYKVGDDKKWWFLIKDSSSGSRNCAKESGNFGYYFFHEDYVKLKMMTILVHRDMMKPYLEKFR